MASTITTAIRKLILIGDGLAFGVIAIGVLFFVGPLGKLYGYTLPFSVDGLNEFRAVYIGFWLGLTILFFTAARKYELAILGDLALLMVLLQSMGRLVSFVLDGIPKPLFILFFILESSSSIIALMIRPKTSP